MTYLFKRISHIKANGSNFVFLAKPVNASQSLVFQCWIPGYISTKFSELTGNDEQCHAAITHQWGSIRKAYEATVSVNLSNLAFMYNLKYRQRVYYTQLRRMKESIKAHSASLPDEIGQLLSVSPSMGSLHQNEGIV